MNNKTANKAHALMILGTASHVGKSLLTAAFCRILRQEGFSVAPFKAQNMALNSAATPDGLEIGRAQWMQAEAAGIVPTVDMNPVLIKPSSDTGAQVIVRGRVWGQVTARDYHRRRVEELFPLVVESYENLAARHDFIILEGAGSPAEINLKARDIVNLRMAAAANARCVLVGDIDRGGVFASLYGTLALLEKEERKLIRGFIVNKFRGDAALLQPGVEMIEARIKKPCVGVVHHLPEVGLDEEDSVSLETIGKLPASWLENENAAHRALRIGVVALPFVSNFTDFDALDAEAEIALAFLTRPEDAEKADVIVIPGSKQTIADMQWMQKNGFAETIRRHAQSGKLTVGICGGMQMLGFEIDDAMGLEGGGKINGLELLPIRTRLNGEKITVPASGEICEARIFGVEIACREIGGYEIHLGETVYEKDCQPFARVFRKTDKTNEIIDGAVGNNGKTIGTYLHGLFDDDDFRHGFLQAARRASGLDKAKKLIFHRAEKESRFDRLAAHVREAIDLQQILSWFR
ncbi:MAG TPA: cobyric acid synthase [Pyrinomonadaceae bacterium]|nr:cobyric acid synthase [Pyrinomonadaceae bacterium]